MKTPTHVLFGLALWFLVTGLFELIYPIKIVAVVAIFALLPDIDYPRSWMGFISGPIARFFENRFGHRGFFHSLLAIGLLAVALRPIYLFTDYQVVYYAALVGYSSHILADMMSLGGVKFFWPSKSRAVLPGESRFRVRSGTNSERWFFIGILIVALLLFPVSMSGVSALISEQTGPDDGEIAVVTRVIDGDTIEVKTGMGKKTVRLIGIDTPETWRANECYGNKSKKFTTKMLDGEVVKLTTSTYGEPVDVYGRLLRYVWLDIDGDGDREDFDKILVKRGYAKLYTSAPHDYELEYRRARNDARKADRGLWGACS